MSVEIFTAAELVRHVAEKVSSTPPSPTYSHYQLAPTPPAPAPYVLILGAGFSRGIVPLVRELMCETIGDYFVPDQDQSSLVRPAPALREHSATFWSDLNAAARQRGATPIALDDGGLPVDAGAAYRALFEIEDARFVRGFLQYVLDAGSEHGHGSTGRADLNAAHIFLAAILEAQQTGKIAPFCRTILTTNFDTLLQNALQMVNLVYRLTDRPEAGFDPADLGAEETAIHLVYVHGSILRHNPASSVGELSELSSRNAAVLRDFLRARDVITIGYSGWNDALMAALAQCDDPERTVYWCDVRAAPTETVATFLRGHRGNAKYVSLGEKRDEGADGLMSALYWALRPSTATRDPIKRYADWRALTYATR
jgi:hypothetical protein